jgi:hypothetical protein
MANSLVVTLLLKTGAFSNDLKTAGGQVKNFKKGCQDAGDAVSAFTKGLGLNVGTLTKFGTLAGAAAAAGKVLKDSFKQNTDAMDAFNREAEVVKSTYRSLTSQLFKNGSMSFDFKGIADQAREYYDAMDSASVASVAITNELKLQQVEYDRLYATAMDVSLSEVDRLDALNEASAILERQITLKRQMAQFDRMAAKEGLENGLVSAGINKYWLETQGQQMLKDLLQFDESKGQYMFDTYFGSVNPTNARTGIFGHGGAYDRVAERLGTPSGADAVEAEAKAKGYKDVKEYLEALKKEQLEATATINSTKYQLAQALHNMRGSTEGFEQISKYILLYLNDMGLAQVNAESQATRAMIERLRKRIEGGGGSGKNYKEGSIGFLENRLTELNEEWKSTLDQTTRDSLKDQIDATQATIDVMKGIKKNTELTRGSEAWLKDELDKMNTELSNLDLGLPETGSIIQKMNDWEGNWEDFVNSLTEEERKLFEKFAEAMKKRWDITNLKMGYEAALSSSQGNKTQKKEKKEYKEGSYMKMHENLENRIEDVTAGLKEGVNLSDEEIKKKIDELKKLQLELDDLEEKFGFKVTSKTTDGWKEFNSAMADTATIVNALASSFQDGMKLTAASILKMVSTALPALSSLIGTLATLAGVEATEKAVQTSKHWIEAIAAVAALGAAVATALSASKSGGKFANGGIVGGSSFTGDRVTAQVNSGEMILNKSQQARLFKIANGGATGGQVEFHISGTELVGVLNNQNRKNNLIR